jgi:protein required for attachment to host cells
MKATISTQPTGAQLRAMDLAELRAHIRTLITLDESEAPLVTAYVPIGRHGARPNPFEGRVREIRKLLTEEERALFDEPFESVLRFLAREVEPPTRGVAAFARGGKRPFFLGLQFQVPVPERLSVGPTPDVYHLVELKDTYHRYVVLISTAESARILEVNLGAITREVWTERPELRERVGREWTHEHYQDHRRERGERFVKEKVELLERLMDAGGHTHLILAGNPRMTAHIRKSLPKRLLDKLVDVVSASGNARVEDIVEATLSTFIDRERQESLDAVAELLGAIKRGGLAAAGTSATLAALRRGQADVLVMAKQYALGPAWGCRECGWVDAMSSRPDGCRVCGGNELKTENLREVMVRLAERQGLEVEIVEHSDVLMSLGGVGCLLRYANREPEEGDADE